MERYKRLNESEIDLEALSKEDLQKLLKDYEDIFHRTLDPDARSMIKDLQTAVRGFDASKMKNSKMKKSKRVTPFTRGRN